MTADRTVLLRGWPGLDGWKAPTLAPSATYPGLGRRPALYLFAAARTGAVPETFGLGAAIVARGPSVLNGTLVVPDDADADTFDRLRAWATAHPLATLAGARPWHVATVSGFFDPFATVGWAPYAFGPTAYSGRGWVVGANLGRTFGLSAEHVVARIGKHRDGWALWLPGWGRRHEDGAVKRRSPHRPCLNVKARRVGWQVEFGPVVGTNGKRTAEGQWRGAFLDVQSLAYALDGDRGATYAEHCAGFGIDAGELPLAVDIEDGAEQVTAALDGIRRLAAVLDHEAGRWLSSSTDRREQVRRFDLARTVSPGALAGHVLRRFGVRPPLLTMDLDDAEHRGWAETFRGGWCRLDPRFAGVPFDAAAADEHSCYPLVAHHLRWWDFLTADHIERRDVTDRWRELCRRAAQDPTVVLDPASGVFGIVLVEVIPDGERFVVSVDDRLRPDGRTEVVAVHAEGRPMFYAGQDVVMAAVLSGREPHIVRAVEYVPAGRQDGLRRRMPLLPGLVLDAGEDPVVAMILRRFRAKDEGDKRIAALLRVVANSVVYGVPSRFDDIWHRTGRHEHRTDWTRTERPGPWSCLPVASSVAAGARLLLAVLDRQVRGLGGVVAYCDTDSSIIPASPEGGTLTLADGSVVRSLEWADVGRLFDGYAALSPAEGWPVWSVERGSEAHPLRVAAFAPKRHASWTGGELVTFGEGDSDDDGRGLGDDQGGLDDFTEAMLGATFVDPPGMPGRIAGGRLRRWSEGAVVREVERAEAGDAWPWRPVPWEDADDVPFPALRRFSVRTPAMAKALPASLGARPGTCYLRAERRWQREARVPVVLDPGGTLSDWQSLPWIEVTGAALCVSTDALDQDAVQLASLADKGRDWSRPSQLAPVDAVAVTPANIAHRGRVSGVLDADAAGMPGNLDDYRPSYAADRPPCALPGCTERARSRSTTCSERHRKALARRAAPGLAQCTRPRPAPVMDDPYADFACPLCGSVLLGAAREACPICADEVALAQVPLVAS